MAGRWNLLILALHLSFVVVLLQPSCHRGFQLKRKKCIDVDECAVDEDNPDQVGLCGKHARCFNTNGSFYCQCVDGFRSSLQTVNFSADTSATCQDINECTENPGLCGPNTKCINTIPHYSCICDDGFISRKAMKSFRHGDSVTCKELNCDVFKSLKEDIKENLPAAHDLVMLLEKSCLALPESKNSTEPDGEDFLERLLTAIDSLLSTGVILDNKQVSIFLDLVEKILRLIAPFTKAPKTTRSTSTTELELRLHKGTLPQGAVTLSSTNAWLDIQLETAAGDLSSYPGFTTVSLLSYANLEKSANDSFSGMKPQKNQSFEIDSKVMTVTVSNKNTSHLKEPVKLTFKHLKQENASRHCVFWDSSEDGGTWSARGCSVLESNAQQTVCSCNHLSSFAVLMARHDLKDRFELKLITWIGLSLSLICLFICILTFSLIRSIQGPRTTIHLHLCISLFIANLIFLAGISRTENKVGCAVVAGLLHFFYLAAFCWMCLEGIQLFRMVVLVFHTNFKTRYMMAGGYGVPAVIVGISALVNAKGYGTQKYCWLNLDFIWSFFGPVCVIIIVNIFFFLITVWKLAQKFSSLNPDLNNLQKIKAFTITAVAQLCVLGIMWIFGCFQFEEGTIAMSYLFTIFGSLQGVMLFVMHCLFSKQVRDEYGNILSRCCAPRKKSYSEFSQSSSKAHASKSTQDTGQSHI